MLERGSNHFDSDLATCRASRRWRALASDGWGQTAGGPVGWPAAVGSASSLSSCPSWQISVGSRDKNLVLSMANDLGLGAATSPRSEEHTSELQSLMRISYAVFCLK